MKRICEIIDEVKALRGANVEVFGQPTTLTRDYGKYIIDTIDILKNLEDYEIPEIIDYWTFKEEDGEDIEVLEEITCEEYLEILDDNGFLVEENMGNTYNWSAPISNDFYYHIYKNLKDDNLIIKIAIHRYGDVRRNYTDEFCIIVDNEEEFFDILCESDISNTAEVDGIEYNVITRFDGNIVVNSEDGYYIGEIYFAEDDAEVIEEIRVLIEEEEE